MSGLFDYDPYGVDILKCYKIGSKASAGEAALAIPEMRWIGVKAEDILTTDSGMPLTPADRSKAHRLMEGTMVDKMMATGIKQCRDELQRMLMLNRKAEIQSLDVGRWLEGKMWM